MLTCCAQTTGDDVVFPFTTSMLPDPDVWSPKLSRDMFQGCGFVTTQNSPSVLFWLENRYSDVKPLFPASKFPLVTRFCALAYPLMEAMATIVSILKCVFMVQCEVGSGGRRLTPSAARPGHWRPTASLVPYRSWLPLLVRLEPLKTASQPLQIATKHLVLLAVLDNAFCCLKQ